MEDIHILKAVAITGVNAYCLSTQEAERLRQTVEDQWAATPSKSLPLWERLRDSAGKRLANGWRLACDFAGPNEVILFFDVSTSSAAWKFSSGDALLRVLEECPAMEFYLTNAWTQYVLCHNHHDYLVGVGSCKEWLEGLHEDKSL